MHPWMSSQITEDIKKLEDEKSGKQRRKSGKTKKGIEGEPPDTPEINKKNTKEACVGCLIFWKTLFLIQVLNSLTIIFLNDFKLLL